MIAKENDNTFLRGTHTMYNHIYLSIKLIQRPYNYTEHWSEFLKIVVKSTADFSMSVSITGFFLLHVCFCVLTHATEHMWKAEDQLLGVGSLLPLRGPSGSKHHYPPLFQTVFTFRTFSSSTDLYH